MAIIVGRSPSADVCLRLRRTAKLKDATTSGSLQ